MKYQFQFAGANVSRRSSPQKKRLRLGLLGAAFLLAGLAYWQYLAHLTHASPSILPAVSHAAATKVASPPVPAVATATTVAADAPLSPVLKKAADSAVTTVGNYLADAVKKFPTAPAETIQPATTVTAPTPVQPAVKSQVVAPCPPVMRVSSEPPVRRPTRVYTPEERLRLAGMTAFGNVMDLANKYPDSYGFRAEDANSNAKLGEPIPIYTVEESDRVKYQSGQSVKPLLKPTNKWVFPVLMGNRVCFMVQVKYSGEEYVPEKGSKSLGSAWDKIQEKWPATEGYHPCIVVNPEIPGYFFTVPELATPNMTDIVRLTDYQPSLSPADVILASWR